MDESLSDLSLEKLKIVQQLQDLRTEVAISTERLKVLADRVESQAAILKISVERHEHLLFGNGNSGLIVRIDRLEQVVQTVRWLWGFIIPLILSQFYDFFFRK